MKKALLMIGGEFHPFDACGRILADFLKSYGTAECTVTSDREAFRKLGGYDVVIVYTQGGKLSKAQEKGLCDWVAEGGAFIGIHCANDSFVGNERYMEMLGTQFSGHGPVCEFAVNIADQEHEVSRRFSEFRITDEFYLCKRRTKADLHAVMTGKWQFEKQPAAYVREYGRGRVFYTILGHDERAFRSPSFGKLIHRGIWWATQSNKNKAVRCGIVGYGPTFGMGKLHADFIRKTPGLVVTAVCDIDPKRTDVAAKEQPDIRTFDNHKKMAASGLVDIAINITPHNVHAPLSLDLLKAGIGVVSEKPFCITVEQATKMIKAAREKKVLLTVFHCRRLDADYLAIRKIIDDGLIGEPFHCEAFLGSYQHPGDWWRSHKPISGGGIYDWGAHFMDWILNLMPYKMQSVTGFMSKRVWHDVTNEDHCKAIIRFEGNRSGELEVSSIAAVGKPKWRILGTKGGIVYDWNKPVQVTSYAGGVKQQIEVQHPQDDWAPYYMRLADHLLGGEPLMVTPESARRVIAVLELAGKSNKSGKAEPVPFE